MDEIIEALEEWADTAHGAFTISLAVPGRTPDGEAAMDGRFQVYGNEVMQLSCLDVYETVTVNEIRWDLRNQMPKQLRERRAIEMNRTA